MTDLRTAAQAALDTVDAFLVFGDHVNASDIEQGNNDIEQLREALAAPEQEPEPAAPQPIYMFRRKGLDDFCTCTKSRYDELSRKPHLFETKIAYTAPVAVQQGETNVVEALRRCLDELKGHNDSPYCDFRDSFNDIMEQAESALKAKNAEQVATAWMPLPPPPEFGVGGYPVTAPPSREWQELSPLEMQDTLRNCAASTFDKLAPNWYEVRQFARAIESALRAKNTGEQA